VNKIKLLLFAATFAIGIAAFQTQTAPSAAAAVDPNQAGAVLHFATNQLHKPFHLGANGLKRYDCSGLVWRAFWEEGLASKIGGQRTSRGYYNYFRNHGNVTSRPQKGDLVVWAHRHSAVSHVGIFYGYNRYGQPMAISALTSGVAVHRVHGINVPLKAYLHVNLNR
jgi:cell wall-associated NlpC family hydrolase